MNDLLCENDNIELLATMHDFKDTETRKTLGLRWNPASDTFTYQRKVTGNKEDHIAKRQLLLKFSKIYNRLCPVTIRRKLLFQKT